MDPPVGAIWRLADIGHQRPVVEVEAAHAYDALQGKLAGIDSKTEIREVVLEYYLMLYAFTGKEVFLLAIHHYK